MLNYYEYADLVKIKKDQDMKEEAAIRSMQAKSERQSTSSAQRRASSRANGHVTALTPIPESRHEARRANQRPHVRVQRSSSVNENLSLRVNNTIMRYKLKQHGGSTNKEDVPMSDKVDDSSSVRGEDKSTVRREEVRCIKQTSESRRDTRRERPPAESRSDVRSDNIHDERTSTAETAWSNAAASSTRVMTIPVPTDNNPVVLEVCINVLSQDKKVVSNSKDAYTVMPREYSNINGYDMVPKNNLSDSSQIAQSKKLSPQTALSIEAQSVCSNFDVSASGQKHAERPCSNLADNSNYSAVPPDNEIFITRDTQPEEVQVDVHGNRQESKVSKLYRIPRPQAPTPASQAQDCDNEPTTGVRPMMTSPKYTEYAMQYQDRGNFKIKSNIVRASSSEMVNGNCRPEVVSDKGGHQKPRPNIQDSTESGRNEGIDVMVQSKKVVRNPSNYRSATALRIRIPMESDRNNESSIRHSHSMEDMRGAGAPNNQDTQRQLTQGNSGGGQLQRYASDPMVSGGKLSDEYIDTYKVEMEVMRKRGTSNRLSRPSTAAVSDARSEVAQIEAERRRKHKLLHSAIKGWGSTTMVLRPKSDKKQIKYNTPLMITAMPRLTASAQQGHQRQVATDQHPGVKLDPRYHTDTSNNNGQNQQPHNSQVCQVQIRLQRKTRPKTSVARDLDLKRPDPIPHRPKTASSVGHLPTSAEIEVNEPISIQPVPGTAIARNIRQLRYNRPHTGIPHRTATPEKSRTVLDRLAIFGNQLRTETPPEEFPSNLSGTCMNENCSYHHHPGEQNWGFMAEFDEKGRPKTPKTLPDHVNMYSPNVPNTNAGNYGSRLNSEVGLLMQQMEFSFNAERRKKKMGNDLICY